MTRRALAEQAPGGPETSVSVRYRPVRRIAFHLPGVSSMPIKIALLLALILASATPAFAQQGQGGAVARELRSACQADTKKHCDGIQPGGGRLLQCLKGKQAELSQPCQAALGKLPAR
jgi:hypothetical protein